MANFITNTGEERNLKERLVELIERSEELKFLVGFFYFSGIHELYDTLNKRSDGFTLKVLVGLNVDKLVSGIAAEYEDTESKNVREQQESYIDSVIKSFNNDKCDTETFFKQIDFFVELIRKGRLTIRKTRNPNHAKLYIFKFADQIVTPELFITGSSNLTSAGLTTQEEFNIEIKDYGVDKANEFFDNLWNDAVPITERDEVKERLLEAIETKTLVKKVSPFEAFALVLKTYLETREGVEISPSLKGILKKRGYTAYAYQMDAVRQAVKILNTYDGVIVADVVGLGKSIVASMIAKETNKRGIILCPPGLQAEWREYTEDFMLHSWEVLSSGNLDKASDFIKDAHDSIEVVIIDEAHRFRNSDTETYEKLKNICRERKVVLLSATPFNNSPEDILALLELFTVPKQSLITLDGDLKGRFRAFKIEYDKLSEIKKNHNSTNPDKKARAEKNHRDLFGEDVIDMSLVESRAGDLATKIRSVIEPVVIRRNRLDLKGHPDYKKEVSNLSDVSSPEPSFYELTPEQSDFYDQVLNDYFGDEGVFTGAIYKPHVYKLGKKEEELDREENRVYQSERNTSDFMRKLLVKRLESSFGSFEQSIANFIAITEKILLFIERNDKYVFNRKLIEKLYEWDEDVVVAELKKYSDELGMVEEKNKRGQEVHDLKEFELREQFIEDIKSDLELYKTIRTRLLSLQLVKNDPKSKKVIEVINNIISATPEAGEPNRKVILFTEYRDTANFLLPILEKAYGEKLLFSGDMGPEIIEKIRSNFDAARNESEQDDTYQILLATDKVSEGFNLNRAGVVINYDIPWNPVRVIQRVGRINRISKKVFNTLKIINFFPTERGKAEVDIEAIAANKMFMIHSILGEDAKIFHADEEPSPAALYQRLTQDPDEEEESFETKMIRLYRELCDNNPGLEESLKEFPSRVKVAKACEEKSLLVFSRRERLHIQRVHIAEDNKRVAEELPLEKVYSEIEFLDPAIASLPLSSEFWGSYLFAKEHRGTDTTGPGTQSIEAKCNNLLNSIIQNSDLSDDDLRNLAQVLLEDINEYGTLTQPTMRRISQLENVPKEGQLAGLKDVVTELGGIDYLTRLKAKIRDTKQEIVIAVENL
jgi:ERCC4-related helicase/HKD family nuclease